MEPSEINIYKRFYLSTGGYYFKYRLDKNNDTVVRATLYRESPIKNSPFINISVDDVRVSEGYGMPEKSEHDVINYFEARIQQGLIK